MAEILSHDPVTGITIYHDYDSLTDKTTLHTVQDVEPILDANKELYKLDNRGDIRRAARIPVVLIEKWLREEGIDVFNRDHYQAVARKLNSSEYLYLRTAPGHIGNG